MLNLLLSFLAALAFPTWISDSTISFSNSVFSLCLWIPSFCCCALAAESPLTRRLNVCSYALGLLFSTMIAFGHALGMDGAPFPMAPCRSSSILLYAYHRAGRFAAL